MISVEQARTLLNDPTLSDEEVAAIRDELRLLAEIIYDRWIEQKQPLTNHNDQPTNPSEPTVRTAHASLAR